MYTHVNKRLWFVIAILIFSLVIMGCDEGPDRQPDDPIDKLGTVDKNRDVMPGGIDETTRSSTAND